MLAASLVPSRYGDGPDGSKFRQNLKNENRTSGSEASWPQVYGQGIYSAIVKYYSPACPLRRGRFLSRERKGMFEDLDTSGTQLHGVVATGCDT